jgi:hypothetical protein
MKISYTLIDASNTTVYTGQLCVSTKKMRHIKAFLTWSLRFIMGSTFLSGQLQVPEYNNIFIQKVDWMGSRVS